MGWELVMKEDGFLLLLCFSILIAIFYIFKQVRQYKYTIIGFLFGTIIVPIFYLFSKYSNILTFLLIYGAIGYVLATKGMPIYKALMYPIAIYMIILFFLYFHFGFIAILFRTDNNLELYSISALIYSVFYCVVGYLIDKKNRYDEK